MGLDWEARSPSLNDIEIPDSGRQQPNLALSKSVSLIIGRLLVARDRDSNIDNCTTKAFAVCAAGHYFLQVPNDKMHKSGTIDTPLNVMFETLAAK